METLFLKLEDQKLQTAALRVIQMQQQNAADWGGGFNVKIAHVCYI